MAMNLEVYRPEAVQSLQHFRAESGRSRASQLRLLIHLSTRQAAPFGDIRLPQIGCRRQRQHGHDSDLYRERSDLQAGV